MTLSTKIGEIELSERNPIITEEMRKDYDAFIRNIDINELQMSRVAKELGIEISLKNPVITEDMKRDNEMFLKTLSLYNQVPEENRAKVLAMFA